MPSKTSSTKQAKVDEVTKRVLANAPGRKPKAKTVAAKPKPASKPKPEPKPKATARKRTWTDEHKRLSQRAYEISQGFGKKSPYPPTQAKLFLDTLEVSKRGAKIVLTRRSDKVQEAFTRAELTQPELDRDVRKRLGSVTSDAHEMYASKLRCYVLAATKQGK